MNSKALGNIGEHIAEEYLRSEGYRILEKNCVYCGCEVDAICEARVDEAGDPCKEIFPERIKRALGVKPKGEKVTVFCEIKTRSGYEYGSGAEAITPEKAYRYITAARSYLQTHISTVGRIRFDVLEVVGEKVRHIKDAFGSDYIENYRPRKR